MKTQSNDPLSKIYGKVKLINEGLWADVQDNNESINQRRKALKHAVQFLKQAESSKNIKDTEDEYALQRVRSWLKDAKDIDEALADGYLSSGYQYDDKDPRNSQFGDREHSAADDRARYGSDRAEQMRSQITQQVAVQHLGEFLNELKEYFTPEMTSTIFQNGEVDDDGFSGYMNTYYHNMAQYHDDRSHGGYED